MDLTDKLKGIVVGISLLSYGCSELKFNSRLYDYARNGVYYKQFCNNQSVDDIGCLEVQVYPLLSIKTK